MGVSESIEFVVEPQHSGMRIDKFLTEAFKNRWSRSFIQKSIKQGGLKINEVVVASLDYKVKVGDICVLNLQEPEPCKLQPSQGLLDIIYEDEDIIVLNKPEGQVVHLGNGVESGTTLVEALLGYCPLSLAAGTERPGVVHRLDQATSGIILFAKTDIAYWTLTKMFSERQIHKTYHALVWKIPTRLAGTIQAPIGRSDRDRTSMCIRTDGREACTHWELLKAFPHANKALLACHPVTGRTHQIRVHLKSIGHPIVGDPKYGRIPDVRLFLHAYQIEFEHPISHKSCLFKAPWPESFSQGIALLEEELH